MSPTLSPRATYGTPAHYPFPPRPGVFVGILFACIAFTVTLYAVVLYLYKCTRPASAKIQG